MTPIRMPTAKEAARAVFYLAFLLLWWHFWIIIGRLMLAEPSPQSASPPRAPSSRIVSPPPAEVMRSPMSSDSRQKLTARTIPIPIKVFIACNVLFAGALLLYTQKAKQNVQANKERRVLQSSHHVEHHVVLRASCPAPGGGKLCVHNKIRNRCTQCAELKEDAQAEEEDSVPVIDDEKKRTQSSHTIGGGGTSYVSALAQFMLCAVFLLYTILVVQSQLQKGFIYTTEQVCEEVPRTRSLFGSLLSILGWAPGSRLGSLLSFLGFYKKNVRCYDVIEQIDKPDHEIFVQALIGVVVMIRGIFGLALSLMFDYSRYDNALKSISL